MATVLMTLSACFSGPSPEQRRYAFASGRDRYAIDADRYDYLILKGTVDSSALRHLRRATGARLINYEQAFALNGQEAESAKALGFLATTCDGRPIHPRRIPQMTLLDATSSEAVRWRARAIAAETNHTRLDGTYLDTLRAYFPPAFYDAMPCSSEDRRWLHGSILLVKVVRKLTGKMVIENGAGLGSARAFHRHRDAVEALITHGDAVQLEHFARGDHGDTDAALIESLTGRGKLVFAKCDNTRDACIRTFARIATARAFLAFRGEQ